MSPDESGRNIYYIGSNDCKKWTCNQRQEFPMADDPYCVKHSLENFFAERDADA